MNLIPVLHYSHQNGKTLYARGFAVRFSFFPHNSKQCERMPSSSNSKQKKKQSKAQNSPLSSNATTTPSKTPHQQGQEHASLCEEASRKFPSLIAKSAFVAEIIHVDDTVPLFKGFRIWLSEPSMLSSSLSPGSIVSVITITITNTFIIIVSFSFT